MGSRARHAASFSGLFSRNSKPSLLVVEKPVLSKKLVALSMLRSLVEITCAKNFSHVKFTQGAISLISDAINEKYLLNLKKCKRICFFREASQVVMEDLHFVVTKDPRKKKRLEKFLAGLENMEGECPCSKADREGLDYDFYVSFYLKRLRKKAMESDLEVDGQVKESLVFLAYIDTIEMILSIKKVGEKKGAGTIFSRKNTVDFEDVASAI